MENFVNEVERFINRLYGNVGKKIMAFAVILNVVLLVGGIVAFFILICDGYDGNDWIGFVCLLGGFASILLSWLIYGFGQISYNIDAIKNRYIKVMTGSYQGEEAEIAEQKENRGSRPQLEIVSRPLSDSIYCRICCNELDNTGVCDSCGTPITAHSVNAIKCFNYSSGLPSDSNYCPFCGIAIKK